MTYKEFLAWAIDTCSEEGHGLLGRYWWFHGTPPIISPHLEGCETALFRTRAEAREAVKYMKAQDYTAFPFAKVVHVKVRIAEQWR